jgi:hypothetical protein
MYGNLQMKSANNLTPGPSLLKCFSASGNGGIRGELCFSMWQFYGRLLTLPVDKSVGNEGKSWGEMLITAGRVGVEP